MPLFYKYLLLIHPVNHFFRSGSHFFNSLVANNNSECRGSRSYVFMNLWVACSCSSQAKVPEGPIVRFSSVNTNKWVNLSRNPFFGIGKSFVSWSFDSRWEKFTKPIKLEANMNGSHSIIFTTFTNTIQHHSSQPSSFYDRSRSHFLVRLFILFHPGWI